MYKDNRTHRLMVTVIVLLVLVLLSLFALVGVVVLSQRMEIAPEEPLPQSSQSAPAQPEEPVKPEEPELPAESSREEESSSAQVIEPVQPQPVVKPQAPIPASSSSSAQPKEESSKSESAEYDAKTYEKGGCYDSKQTLGNVSIKTGNIILENKTIKGRLNIAKEAYDTIELVDCVVEGPLYIRGGEKIILTDSRVSEVFVMESNGIEVILVADSESRTGKVTAYTSVVLDETTLHSSKQGFSDLEIASGDPTVYVSLVNTMLTRATVDEETHLTIDGGSVISRLRVNEPTVIDGEGEIELLTIASDDITSYIEPYEEEKTKNRFDDVVYLEHTTALSKPTGLAVAYTDSGFRLSWNAVGHATGYLVKMTATGLSYSKTQSGTSIAVGDDFIGKSTTFSVQATTTQAGYSDSEAATLTYTPKQVGNITGFAVDPVSANEVKLVWNAAANAASYTLEYKLDGGELKTLPNISETTKTIEFETSLASGQKLVFTLTAVGDSNTKPAVGTLTYTIS